MKYKNSPWERNVDAPSFPMLSKNIQTDVVVIGAGITGVLTAYMLAKHGKKVVVLEKNKIGFGATGLTTAFLTQSIDTDAENLIDILGKKDSELLLGSHHMAIDTVEQIIQDEKIDCEFIRCSNYTYGLEEKDVKTLEEESKQLKQLNVRNVFTEKSRDDLDFKHVGVIEIKNQAKFHPLKFLYAVVQACEKMGVEFYEKSEAKKVEDIQVGSTKFKKVVTSKGTVEAEWIISATYSPFKEPLELYLKKGMYTSYVFELEIPHGSIAEGLYEDTYNPYHYFRIDKKDGKDRMIIGGEDNKNTFPVDPKKHFSALEEYIKKQFPGLEYEKVYEWSGPILEPSDGFPSIGPASEDKDDRLLYAFGFSGNGMTYSTIAAHIMSDHILGNKNQYAHIFKTSRWMHVQGLVKKAKDYTGEFVGGVLKDVFKREHEDDADQKKSS